MDIKERINKLGTYFHKMEIVTIEDKQIIYVAIVFPNGWIIDSDLEEKYNVTVERDSYGTYYFATEIENGVDTVFDAIDYNIAKMKDAIERSKLLSEKTLELKRLFENEEIPVESLRNLTFKYDNSVNDVIKLSKKKKKDEAETETNNKDIENNTK